MDERVSRLSSLISSALPVRAASEQSPWCAPLSLSLSVSPFFLYSFAVLLCTEAETVFVSSQVVIAC